MNRKGQTWCADKHGVVFTVLRSHQPNVSRRYWVHEIVYLENEKRPGAVGTKHELQEAESRQFEKWLKRVV